MIRHLAAAALACAPSLVAADEDAKREARFLAYDMATALTQAGACDVPFSVAEVEAYIDERVGPHRDEFDAALEASLEDRLEVIESWSGPVTIQYNCQRALERMQDLGFAD
ncbi:MAG: hypothetical protein ACU0BF_09255 [Paracoccaceae bacterium]